MKLWLRIVSSVAIAVLWVGTAAGCRAVRFEVADVSIVSRSAQPSSSPQSTWHAGDGRLIRVEFSTSEVLRTQVDERHLILNFDAKACGVAHGELHYLSLIYDEAGAIGRTRDERGVAGRRAWLFIVERAPVRENADERMLAAYDLQKSPRDVCIHIQARTMALTGFSTHVRVPAQRLRDAFSAVDGSPVTNSR